MLIRQTAIGSPLKPRSPDLVRVDLQSLSLHSACPNAAKAAGVKATVCTTSPTRAKAATANPAGIPFPIRRRANIISNLRGGGGGSNVAYHKPRQKRKRRKRRIGGRCRRRVGEGCSLRGGFWVETNEIIPLSRGRLQIKGVASSSSCCAGGREGFNFHRCSSAYSHFGLPTTPQA